LYPVFKKREVVVNCFRCYKLLLIQDQYYYYCQHCDNIGYLKLSDNNFSGVRCYKLLLIQDQYYYYCQHCDNIGYLKLSDNNFSGVSEKCHNYLMVNNYKFRLFCT